MEARGDVLGGEKIVVMSDALPCHSVERSDVSRQTVTSIFRVEGCDRYFPQNVVFIYLLIYSITFVGRDNSVGEENRYGLDGPGIESWWGRDFPHPSRPVLGSTDPPVQWIPCLSRW